MQIRTLLLLVTLLGTIATSLVVYFISSQKEELRGMPMQRFDGKYIVMLGIGLLSLRSSLWKTLDQEVKGSFW